MPTVVEELEKTIESNKRLTAENARLKAAIETVQTPKEPQELTRAEAFAQYEQIPSTDGHARAAFRKQHGAALGLTK